MHRLARLANSALLLLVATAAASPARGQATMPADTALRVAGPAPRPATDSLFRRARRLVAEGNGVAGRALVDSLLRAAEPTSPAYGDALYWHGVLAPTAAEAERDYRRVIVEYPLAYYAHDALLAIAELEQARGDRAGALMHLQRYVKDHPASPERGVAALGAARLAFEQRDPKLGCAMIATARASASASDVELRNQIDYHGRQCTGAAAVSPAVAITPPAPAPTTPPRRVSTTAAGTTMPEPVAPATPGPRVRAPVRPAPARDTVVPPPAAPPSRARPARAGTMYTIQLAAYDTRPPAEQLVRRLATRGVTARVSGTVRPFRVRLDFYRTRQEAANVVASLKARGIIGFVAEETPPPEPGSP